LKKNLVLKGRSDLTPDSTLGFQVSDITAIKPGLAPAMGGTCITLYVNKFDCRNHKDITQLHKILKEKVLSSIVGRRLQKLMSAKFLQSILYKIC